MNDGQQADAADVLASIGRHWGWIVGVRGPSAHRARTGPVHAVDWNSGHSISETIWDSPKTLAASRSVAARVRVETVKSTECVIRALEEYDLVFNTARIGGV